jgi:hypothetical protein
MEPDTTSRPRKRSTRTLPEHRELEDEYCRFFTRHEEAQRTLIETSDFTSILCNPFIFLDLERYG